MEPEASDRIVDWEEASRRPYLLLTPGPLTTTPSVRAALLKDWCTWDDDYNAGVVQEVRRRLVELATPAPGYTCVLMQGSGTFTVEATVGTVVGRDDRLLVLANGAYGDRIAAMAAVLGIDHAVVDFGELGAVDPAAVSARLDSDPGITHVAMVHCETTTGRLNPAEEVAALVRQRGRVFILDAISSFGGLPLDVAALGVDYLVSSANKCIQGVPGFGFTIAPVVSMQALGGRSRSLSLDLHGQWLTMEEHHGRWRYTSPTHVVRAFLQALVELEAEGGIAARHARYAANQRRLVAGMRALGFETLIPDADQSPFITAFSYPRGTRFTFTEFYAALKQRGFVIYPGKVTAVDAFRIGNIGDVHPADIEALLAAVAEAQRTL